MLHTLSLYAIAAMFVAAGIAHFVRPQIFIPLVPPYFPAPKALVYLSGVAEIAGGVGVLIPAVQVYAGWGLIVLLLALLPVHTYMARHPDAFSSVPTWALYARIPLQFVLMGWVYATVC